MSGLEIAGGIVMILLSIVICLLVLLQEGTRGGGVAALTGSDPDSFYSKNPGRTLNILLFKATRLCAIIFFIITIVVHAINLGGY